MFIVVSEWSLSPEVRKISPQMLQLCFLDRLDTVMIRDRLDNVRSIKDQRFFFGMGDPLYVKL